jgi:DNA-binding response OmpR family regulator
MRRRRSWDNGVVIASLCAHAPDRQGVRSRDFVQPQTALESKERIDLLVSDVGLPGLNGRQLADHARLVRPHLKVLFITSCAEQAAIASGFLAPGMEMITKPFAIVDLAVRIREIIERA